jgi:hypothetical protein
MALADEQEHFELHDTLDKIIRGPGSTPDSNAIEALIGIGKIIAAAQWALDYEMGRIKAGRWRSRSNLLLSNYDLPEEARQELVSWVGTSLTREEEQAFIEEVRSPGTLDEERLLIATVMAAFAIGSQRRTDCRTRSRFDRAQPRESTSAPYASSISALQQAR